MQQTLHTENTTPTVIDEDARVLIFMIEGTFIPDAYTEDAVNLQLLRSTVPPNGLIEFQNFIRYFQNQLDFRIVVITSKSFLFAESCLTQLFDFCADYLVFDYGTGYLSCSLKEYGSGISSNPQIMKGLSIKGLSLIQEIIDRRDELSDLYDISYSETRSAITLKAVKCESLHMLEIFRTHISTYYGSDLLKEIDIVRYSNDSAIVAPKNASPFNACLKLFDDSDDPNYSDSDVVLYSFATSPTYETVSLKSELGIVDHDAPNLLTLANSLYFGTQTDHPGFISTLHALRELKKTL